jgi:outer membrane protein assembly factor BamB
MVTRSAMLALSALAAVCGAFAAAAEPRGGTADWPQFRGPSGDGISAAKGLPLTWSETENVAWKVAVGGRGHSSPIVLGDRIWLTTAYETAETPERTRERLRGYPQAPGDVDLCASVRLCVVCLDRATGRQLYETELFRVTDPLPVHKLNSFATPTPVAEPGRVYCDFGAMGTACIEAGSGKMLWTQRLDTAHLIGPGSSPVLYKNRLVLVRDGCDTQYVAALDTQTGEVAWKTPRPPIDARYDARKAYSTPLLIEAGGTTQTVAAGAHWVVSYDPLTGKELWRVRHGTGYSLAPRPLFGNGLVYSCTGCLVPQLWAIRPDGRGDVTATHVAWKATDPIPVMPTPILVGKELTSVHDTGALLCFDALTGEVLWRNRLPGKYEASPVFADGRLHFWATDGRATVLKAGRQFEKLAESKLDGAVIASPAFVGNTMLVRTLSHLYCITNAQGR